MSLKHESNGSCLKCFMIANRYGKLNQQLMDWFTGFQRRHPEFHVSCGGRGRQDQEELFTRKASNAHWTQSAHNWNAALDLFIQKTGVDIYDRTTFQAVLKPELPSWITWYGEPNAKFKELPHIEITDFEQMSKDGRLTLIAE